MALAPHSTPFAALARAIVTQACNAIGLAPSFNHVVSSDDYKVTEEENLFLYFQFFEPVPEDGQGNPLGNQGAGRLALLVGRRCRVYIYTRSGVDTYGDDTIALTGNDPTQTVATPPTMPGHFVAEELVLDALHNWAPPNEAADGSLTVGPVHWLDSAGGPPLRKPENEDGLTRSNLDFEIVYNAAIRSNEPAVTYSPPPPPP